MDLNGKVDPNETGRNPPKIIHPNSQRPQSLTEVAEGYFAREGVLHLQSYHYTGTDCSLLAPAFYLLWRPIIQLFPPTTSPCVYSTIGLLFSFIGYFIVYWQCPYLDCFTEVTATPNIKVFALAAVALFVYQTFDALDGLQSKRVNMYHSPMAELFDHVCDSITTVLYGITMACAFQLGASWASVLLLLSSFVGFFAPTWEHMHVGVMRFQQGPLNPTEALIILQIALYITSVAPHFWSQPMFWDLELRHVMAIVSSFIAFCSLASSIQSISWHARQSPSLRKINVSRALSQLIVLAVLALGGFIWLCCGPESKAFMAAPRMSLLLFSLPWLHTISHLIVCEITKQQLSVTALLKAHIPLLVMAVVKFLPMAIARHEVLLMRLCTFVSLIHYCMWMSHVIDRFCYHLGMKHWWSVPPFHPPTTQAQSHSQLSPNSEQKIL
jgi:phosphatidylglycerophosphate synthase